MIKRILGLSLATGALLVATPFAASASETSGPDDEITVCLYAERVRPDMWLCLVIDIGK